MEHSHIKYSDLPVRVKATALGNTPLAGTHTADTQTRARAYFNPRRKDSILPGQFIPRLYKILSHLHYKKMEKEGKKEESLDEARNKRS